MNLLLSFHSLDNEGQFGYFKKIVDSAKKLGSISLEFDLDFLNIANIKNTMSLENYCYLADQLKDSNIENINLKNLISSDDQLITISAVLKNTKIKSLNLESNEFGRKGLLKLTSALKDSKIEKLKLSKNRNMGIDAIRILIDSLPTSNITSLDLEFTPPNFNFHCFQHLSDKLACTNITVLSLEKSFVGGMSIKYLSTKLSNSKIQSLNLASNSMTFDSLKSLADVLEDTVITELNIYNNDIRPNGAKYLAEKLSKSVLQKLDIGNNYIKSEGCLAIGNVIHLTQITKLNLEMNVIDSNGITSLADNLKKSNVKHLNLNRNNLGINGAQILADGIEDSDLEYLNVDHNKLTNVGMGMILDALQFTKITDFHLNCESNDMNRENMTKVTNAFQCFKLKNLNLTLPNDENTIFIFFKELKTLIESNALNPILSIKNKMNFCVNSEGFLSINMHNEEHVLNAIKHFYIKKLCMKVHNIQSYTLVYLIGKMLKDIKNPICNLTTLCLTGITIGDDGARILASNFKHLKLTRLEIDNVGIKNDGVIAIANELKNSRIRYLNLKNNQFNSIAASYLTNVVETHPVQIVSSSYAYFSAADKLVLKNISNMFVKAQLLIRSISDNSPVKYDKDLIEYFKAYEIFKNVDLLWVSADGKEYDYHRIDSEIKSNVTRNFLKIIGVVNSDEIISDLLPAEVIIMICSYLSINDIKFKH